MPANRRDPAQFVHALVTSGQPVAAGAAVPRAHAGFGLKLRKECERMCGDPRHRGRGTQGSNDTGRMPTCAGCEPIALKQLHFGTAPLAEMIGHAQSHRAATNDDDFAHLRSSSRRAARP